MIERRFNSGFKPGDRVKVNYKMVSKGQLLTVRDKILTVKEVKHHISHYWIVYFVEENKFYELDKGLLNILLIKVDIRDDRRLRISSLKL